MVATNCQALLHGAHSSLTVLFYRKFAYCLALSQNLTLLQKRVVGIGYGNIIGTGYRNRLQEQVIGIGYRNRLQKQVIGIGYRNILQEQVIGTGYRNRLQKRIIEIGQGNELGKYLLLLKLLALLFPYPLFYSYLSTF